MLFFYYFLLILGIGYVAALIFLWIGLTRLSNPKHDWQPLVSVVIAGRNESSNVPGLVASLQAQDYPVNRFEVIYVNDRSEDDTTAQFSQFTKDDPRFKLINVTKAPQGIAPKKNALANGISHASGEIILTTDADCRPVPSWISSMINNFTDDVGLVAGFSPLELPDINSIARKLYALDSLSLACIAAGSSYWGKMATCSGRNLAYRKQVYEQVGGFQKVAQFISGDDDLFLHLISSETDWKVRYAFDSNALVPAFPVKSLNAFYHQRIRHASKGRHYGGQTTAALIAVYLFNLLLFVTVPLSLISAITSPIPLSVFGAKAFFEFLFLYTGARRVAKPKLLKVFWFAEILHIPYVVIFGAIGQFFKFKWKERASGARLSNKRMIESERKAAL